VAEAIPSKEQVSTPLPSSIEDFHAQETEDQRKHMVAVAEDQSSTPSEPSDEPPVVSSSTDEAVTTDLSSSGMIKPTAGTIEEHSKPLESDDTPAPVVSEKLETHVGGKGSLEQGVGDDSTAKEKVSGSFEH
jgi:hypothetical protein